MINSRIISFSEKAIRNYSGKKNTTFSKIGRLPMRFPRIIPISTQENSRYGDPRKALKNSKWARACVALSSTNLTSHRALWGSIGFPIKKNFCNRFILTCFWAHFSSLIKRNSQEIPCKKVSEIHWLEKGTLSAFALRFFHWPMDF